MYESGGWTDRRRVSLLDRSQFREVARDPRGLARVDSDTRVLDICSPKSGIHDIPGNGARVLEYCLVQVVKNVHYRRLKKKVVTRGYANLDAKT